MMRFLSPKIHGLLDYLLVAVFALTPSFLHLVGSAQILCYSIAVAIFALSLFTRYPLGVVKKIPFPVHGHIELVGALIMITAPWLFGFPLFDTARNFFLFMGGLVVLVWIVTDYRGTRTSTANIGARERERIGSR